MLLNGNGKMTWKYGKITWKATLKYYKIYSVISLFFYAWFFFFLQKMESLFQCFQRGDPPIYETSDFSFNKTCKTVYILDFQKMTQYNTDSKVTRCIRRHDESLVSSKKFKLSSGTSKTEESATEKFKTGAYVLKHWIALDFIFVCS